MGYTQPVRDLLQGKANVHRIPDNGGPSTHGIQFLESWLGKEQWDVIHFNFGLHDLKLIWDDASQVSVQDYERDLRRIVQRLRKTGAHLVWASTTPVPEGPVDPPRSDADVLRYNRAAARVMKENGIPIDDLYTLVQPRLADLQQKQNVHFKPDGYDVLAAQVAASITTALDRARPHATKE